MRTGNCWNVCAPIPGEKESEFFGREFFPLLCLGNTYVHTCLTYTGEQEKEEEERARKVRYFASKFVPVAKYRITIPSS